MRNRAALVARTVFFLLVCLLAGCSALRIGYANGERVAYWWLDSYVDFRGEQKPRVKSDIADLLAWHRRTQLPDYAEWLAHLQRQLQQPASTAGVLDEYAALQLRAMRVADRALPVLARLALTLQPQQIAHIESRFASNDEKYRKEHLQGDLEQRQLKRYRQLMKQAEYWFGDFSQAQRAQIRAASDARPLDDALWLAERQRRQQELLALLRRIAAEKPAPDAAAAMLRAHLKATLELFTYPEHKAFFDAAREANASLVAQIVNLATPAQRAHAAARLQQLIDDCRALAAPV